MPRRTIHGNLLPDNDNRIGRPPRTIPVEDPDVANLLTSRDIVTRLRELAQHAPEAFAELQVDLQQHHRAMRHDRSLPGEYMGDDSLPYLAMPFAPKETYRPDRVPGTFAHEVYSTAVNNLEKARMTEDLIAQMGRHDPPDVRAERAASFSAEPSLREVVEGASSLHFPKE